MYKRQAQNLVVIKTMPGLANGAAAALDGMEVPYQMCIRDSPYLRRDAGEAGADVGLVGPGADQVTGGALTQHGAQRVNDDGFTGAGLAGEGVEARLKGDIRPVDDGDIFRCV